MPGLIGPDGRPVSPENQIRVLINAEKGLITLDVGKEARYINLTLPAALTFAHNLMGISLRVIMNAQPGWGEMPNDLPEAPGDSQ